MPTLQQLIPDPEVLLALAPEELAPYLLSVARSQLQNGIFHPDNLILVTVGAGMTAHQQSSYSAKERDIELAVAESWNWLRVQGFIVPARGMNGNSGFCQISRRGQALSTEEDFRHFREAAAFPKAMLHPSIADKVWLDLARGELADAVFVAFRAVEESVRTAGGYGAGESAPTSCARRSIPKADRLPI